MKVNFFRRYDFSSSRLNKSRYFLVRVQHGSLESTAKGNCPVQQLFLGEMGWSILRGASISDLRGLTVLMDFLSLKVRFGVKNGSQRQWNWHHEHIETQRTFSEF